MYVILNKLYHNKKIMCITYSLEYKYKVNIKFKYILLLVFLVFGLFNVWLVQK